MASRGLRLLVVLSAMMLGCESMPGRPQPEDRPKRPSEIASFDVLWSSSCAGCHGEDGSMGAARSLADPLYLAWASDRDLRLAIQQGVRGGLMPAFADGHGGPLTDEQVEILVRGMRERWAKSDRFRGVRFPPYAAPLGQASRGAEVYREYCARCHGDGGEGGEVRGSIVDPSYLALVTNQALRSVVVAGRTDLGMPGYRELVPGKAMSDREIADVVAWLADHRVEFPGRPGGPEEGRDG